MGQVNSDNNQEAHSQAKWRIGDETALFTNSPWPAARALSVVYKSWKLGGVLKFTKNVAKRLSCSEDPTQLVCGGRGTELSQKQIEIIRRVLQFLKGGVLINSKGRGWRQMPP